MVGRRWPGLWLTLALCWPLSASAQSWWNFWSEPAEPVEVMVAAPFIEWRTGPAIGYPVFHSSERGEPLTLLKQHTRWIRVRDGRGREGWVLQDDLARSATRDGEAFVLPRPDLADFQQRRWEGGVWMGDFEGATVISGWAGFQMTPNLATEFGVSQVLGSRSEIRLANLSIQHQPWPHWRLSPYFTLGGGYAWISPKATLASTERRNNPTAHAGLGVRYYLADRYFLRAEVRDYKVFTDRTTNEEVMEWKIGLGLFF